MIGVKLHHPPVNTILGGFRMRMAATMFGTLGSIWRDVRFGARLLMRDRGFTLAAVLLLGLGLVFQMPAVVYFLARMRLVTARFLFSHIKYAVLIIFVLAAVITPSGDMMTQGIFAAPMLGLYLLSIIIAWAVAPRRSKTDDA